VSVLGFLPDPYAIVAGPGVSLPVMAVAVSHVSQPVG